MSRKGDAAANPGRRFVRMFPSLGAKPNISPTMHMFIEDVQTGIMPFRPTIRKRQLSARLDGPEPDAKIAVALCRQLSSYPSRHDPLIETVSDAIREIAKHLLWEGQAAYELHEPDLHQNEDGVIVALSGLTTRRLYRIGRFVIQVVPRADSHNYGWRRVSVANNRHLWMLRMPAQLGGPRKYRQLLRRLRKYPLTGPPWAVEAIFQSQHKVRFDVTGYTRLKEAYQARATELWGWRGRDYSDRHHTEFYLFYRLLRFQWALAVLRQHIVEEMNRLFLQVGLNVTLVLEGFPTPDEILDARDEMMSGAISLGEAHDRAYLR